eukprot:GHVT01044066.1.p1 GENE.GHVT01044066.1~~GHVT01044066.1.p1  ORF type:complete len:426 (+),score=45.37 GHVT01044066.1:3674-4951(+)
MVQPTDARLRSGRHTDRERPPENDPTSVGAFVTARSMLKEKHGFEYFGAAPAGGNQEYTKPSGTVCRMPQYGQSSGQGKYNPADIFRKDCRQPSSGGTGFSSETVQRGEDRESTIPEACKELLEGDIREDILNWVLSMKLSKADRVEEKQIAGLQNVKKMIRDKIIYPIMRPDLHTGLHSAPRGILLFGPPGTGKTTLAKWIATASGGTFFEVTPASIISKYHGETETLVKALFKVAEVYSPSLIFIDEIDSLLGKRRDKEEDATIRMKNQMLQMMDGVSNDPTKMIVVVGATNRPDMLDEAAIRRLSKRVLVPLPDFEARKALTRNILSMDAKGCQLSEEEVNDISVRTEGWNGSDIKALCAKASEYSYDDTIEKFGGIQLVPDKFSFRPITHVDFQAACLQVHASSSSAAIDYDEWAKQFGVL